MCLLGWFVCSSELDVQLRVWVKVEGATKDQEEGTADF